MAVSVVQGGRFAHAEIVTDLRTPDKRLATEKTRTKRASAAQNHPQKSELSQNFDTNDHLRIHQQNRYPAKWLLARMTDYIEVKGGLASRFSECMSEGRKTGYEVEHIWADHWTQHRDEFSHEADFDEWRNRLGGLLLLPKTFNASFGDLPYVKKLPKYFGQNLLAKSLTKEAYSNNPPLKKLISAGLPFTAHLEFRKADIEKRQALYALIAKQLWNPDRLKE